MNSGNNLKHLSPKTVKNSLPVLTELGSEKQVDFSGELHNEHVTGEPYNLIRIDRYSKWPSV